MPDRVRQEISMRQSDSPVAARGSRSSAKAPPAWLLTASMFAFAVVTIVLVVTGQ